MATGAADYDDLLKDELASEDARKASLEQRGLGLITTSGALVTLLFGLGALATKPDATFDLSAFAGSALGVALVLFVIAAVMALLTNAPFFTYNQASPSDVRKLLEATPMDGPDAARKDVALVRADELESARSANGCKANILLAAMGVEVLAVVAVAAAVWDVLSPF